MRQGEAPIGGRPTSAGVGDLVRQAAEAFEAQLLPMFEGYMVSMKDHISKELSKLMTEVASANSSIAAVETFVKTELATLRNGTAGVDMYSGDLFSGYSPAMRSPSHGPSSPSRQRNKGTAETRVDVEDSPQIDELDGNAAIGKKSCLSETAPGDPKSDRLESLIEETVTGATPTSSSGVDVFVDVSEECIFLTVQPSSSIPASDGGNAVVSASAEAGTTFLQPAVSSLVTSEVSFTNSGFPSSAIVYSTNFRLIFVGTYFHQTENPQAPSTLLSSPFSAPLSDTPPPASSAVVEVPSDVSHTNTEAAPGSTVDAIPTELPVSPSSIHEVRTDVSDTVRGPSAASIVETDDVGGSVATEEDEILTKKTPSKQRKAGRAVKLTTVVPSQACTRYSKRERRNPDRYTPSEGPEKQEPGKRARRGEKEKENVVASIAEPSIPIKETTSLIGGFTPFLPPNPVKRATFLEAMKDAKTQSAAKDSAFQVHTLMPLFDSSRVASEKEIDCVVAFIRKRRDGLSRSRFDFIEASFFSDLLTNFREFKACSAKEAFSFSPSLKKQFTDRPQWFTQVDILHIPVLMKKRQWVGVIVDLNMWAMLDMPCVVGHPVGCSAVVALMLLEMHAVGKDVTVMKFTEEQAQTAGENYAVDALHLCQAVPIPSTQ
ncbi:unnamed protein product [Brassica napus]|uniref:(rape) hypothetical protein n=1 Tax=Brassica napus TaxID=3708 RepID=A0A816TJ21_BRANA|nr:unnamed protein product [Brassica napus]